MHIYDSNIIFKLLQWLSINLGYLFFSIKIILNVKSEICSANKKICTFADCEYNGRFYNPGDRFTASDGCNVFSCNQDGTVDCTDQECDNCKFLNFKIGFFLPQTLELYKSSIFTFAKALIPYYFEII